MDTTRIVETIDGAYAAGAFPCAVISVVEDGGPRFFSAVGRPDPESPDSMEASAETVFDVASLTKSLATSLVALKAVESGALSLDAPLSRYLPDAACASLGATVRQLMSHSAGFPPVPELQRYFPDPDDIERDEAVSRLLAVEPDGPPGYGVAYSCTGFLLLGIALERIGGARLSELFAREIAGPLGLGNGERASRDGARPIATFRPGPGLAWRCAPTEVCAWRRRRVRGEVHDESSYCLGGDGGNAGLFANIAGLEALFGVWVDGGKLLREETVMAARALATGGLERRRGLGIQLHDGETCDTPAWPDDSYGHTGFTGTCVWRSPASGDRRGASVISLTNRVYPGREHTADGIIAFRHALHGAVAAGWKSGAITGSEG